MEPCGRRTLAIESTRRTRVERGFILTRPEQTYFTYSTAHGPLTICSNGRAVTRISFEDERFEGTNRPADITNRAATQIQEYLAGKRTAFDVPIAPEGSAFQKEVWAQVCELPYGATCTAAQLAEHIGKAGSHRAVGTAIRRNPIPMIIPAHRVDLPNATGKVARIYRALRAMEQSGSAAPDA